MKNLFKAIAIVIMMSTVVFFTAFSPQQKKKVQDKEQKKDKEQDKDPKADKGNVKRPHDKSDKANTDYDNEKVVRDDKSNQDNKNRKWHDDDKGKSYDWNRETFKDRKKIKNQEKVTICHKFNSNNEPAVTIRVSSHAMKAHMGHGDVMGECPVVTNRSFSDDYLRRRTVYYTDLQEAHEQVLYSQSILDYTLVRLANARLQLTTLQNSNVAVVDIDRKQATVVELEQNATLLETLIGVAVNLFVNKLL